MMKRPIVLIVVASTALLATTCSAAASGDSRVSTASPLGHAIVFTRFLPGADTGSVYRIDAGETVKHRIRSGVFDAALLSPDATEFADAAWTPEGVGTTAIFNVDGTGYRLLPTSDPAMPQNGLAGGTWSAGETRIAASAGDPANPTPPRGIFSRRSSDGGGVIRLTDAGTRFDYTLVSSPDGSKLLFFQPDAKNETSDSAPQDLFVVGANGSGLTRLTPQGTTSAFTPGESVSWSPDGTKVALAAVSGPFWSNHVRSVFIASADGSSFTSIGPRGDIWDAVWSPDGQWIAFSMAPLTGGLRELYLMHPDGSGVRQVTFSSDGLSAMPLAWSPDSRQLLMVRGAGNSGDVDLWSVNEDGSHLYQVTHRPATYLAPAWLP